MRFSSFLSLLYSSFLQNQMEEFGHSLTMMVNPDGSKQTTAMHWT